MRELPRLVRRLGAELVHALRALGAAASTVREVPLVVSFCGDDLLGRPDAQGRITSKSRWLVSVSRLAARRADQVIVKSEEMRKRIADVAEVEVIPNGVDLARFNPIDRAQARARGSTGQRTRRCCCSPARRMNRARILRARPGGGIRGSGARGRKVRLVAFHGRPQADLALAMSGADVLLLPSFHEGSPNVVKEALAMSLPVVAAPAGDCAERLRGVSPGGIAAREPEAFTRAVDTGADRGRALERARSRSCRSRSRRWRGASWHSTSARWRGGSRRRRRPRAEPMCGSARLVRPRRETGRSGGDRAQCATLVHRGPDDQGVHSDGDFGFGMRRLAIIDVAAGISR